MPETNATPEEKARPKYILEYQITDDSGQPLLDSMGKPIHTNLTAETPEEMFEKQKLAHINVTRAYHRALNRKPVTRAAEVTAKELSPEEERQAAADLQDPAKARAAVRKLTGADQMEEDRKRSKEKEDAADAQRAAYQFMSAHIADYYPCQANSAIISKYIADNNLDPRATDNYEEAFDKCRTQLAQRPAPAPPVVPVEEIPPPARRPARDIQPGTLSGARPTMQREKKPLVTKDDIKRMRKTPEGRAEYSRKMKDPAFVAAVDELFAPH